VVGEQEDGCADDGGEPGGDVEEAVQGVDVEDLGGGLAAAQGSDDADQAGEDEDGRDRPGLVVLVSAGLLLAPVASHDAAVG
jgi:hypothetical protein